MKYLALDSLHIRNFRAFEQLTIKHLGRVNLVVGKNNVGKSCLLEALWLYTKRGAPSVILEILESRDESVRALPRNEVGTRDRVLSIKYLFHGRKEIEESPESIQIGPLSDEEKRLSVLVAWYILTENEGRREMRMLQPEDYGKAENTVLGLAAQFGSQLLALQRLDYLVERRPVSRPLEPEGIPCVFVTANGMVESQIGQLWDNIALTDLEEEVLKSLRIITPKIQRVNLVGDQESRRNRIPIVRINGLAAPLPLRSMGEGMNRMLGIALALVNSRDGMLLIDEIESGLHYSIQSDLWRLIFQVAHRLNIQVFATTHSWDCIQAFQQVAGEVRHEEGMLIRLQEREGQVISTEFDERKLGIATRESIEVR